MNAEILDPEFMKPVAVPPKLPPTSRHAEGFLVQLGPDPRAGVEHQQANAFSTVAQSHASYASLPKCDASEYNTRRHTLGFMDERSSSSWIAIAVRTGIQK